MRRRSLKAAVSVQSGRRVSFSRRVARAFTDHSIPGDHPRGNALSSRGSCPRPRAILTITSSARGARTVKRVSLRPGGVVHRSVAECCAYLLEGGRQLWSRTHPLSSSTETNPSRSSRSTIEQLVHSIMRPSINPHVLNLKASATLAINQRVMRWRTNGEEVYHFGFGQSPFPVPKPIQAALIEHADKNSYLPTRGLPELCEAIAVFYDEQCGCSLSPDQVVVGPGSKELIFQVLYLLQGPLLIPAPSWVSYGPQATLRGKEIVTIETRRKLGYRLQADELDQACRASVDSQKILIFNNPNNPSGSSHSEQEIKDLAAVCRTHQLIVISDEIYGLVNFRKEK